MYIPPWVISGIVGWVLGVASLFAFMWYMSRDARKTE